MARYNFYYYYCYYYCYYNYCYRYYKFRGTSNKTVLKPNNTGTCTSFFTLSVPEKLFGYHSLPRDKDTLFPLRRCFYIEVVL